MTVRNALAKAANPGAALAEAAASGRVSHGAILKAVGIDASNPLHQAALLAAEKYGLDPLLKHIIVIPGGGVYVTRDGWLHVAHRDGHLDGIEVIETGQDETHYWATVAVWRKDMGKPFRYTGRYPIRGKNAQYGPEMAVKVAEVAALRRAFPLAGLASYEERWDEPADFTPPAPVEPEHDEVVIEGTAFDRGE